MKKAIVIGASSGIGRELAKLLAEKGYVVGVMARRLHLLESLCNETNGEILVQEIDATDTAASMATLARFIKEIRGG